MSPHGIATFDRGQQRIKRIIRKGQFYSPEGTTSEIFEPRREGKSWTEVHHNRLRPAAYPMPVIVSNFIALDRTMYEKSDKRTELSAIDRQRYRLTDKNSKSQIPLR